MRYVKLEEICFKGVSSLRQKDTLPVGDYPVYGASGICGYLSGYQHNEPYVAVVKDGAGVGRVQLCSGKSSVLGTLQALLPKDEVSCEYLYEVVRSLELGAGFTGSTIPHIYFKDYKNRTVVIYEKEQQTKITTLFTTLKNVVELHKCAISFYDELVKSRFVEMLGGFEKRTLVGDLCNCIVPGRDKPKSFSGETPWITTDDLIDGGITYFSKSGLGLSDEEIEQVHARIIPKDSVLMTCVGRLGICSIAGCDLVANQQLHSFLCDLDSINNTFLMYQLKTSKKYMLENAKSVTVQYMNKKTCNSIPIACPPLSLQQEFADFVHQVDKLKFDFDFLVSFSIPSICLFCLKLDP